MNDPRGGLKLPEDRFAVVPGDPGVDRRAQDVLVTQVVLDEGHGETGVEEMGGDRVSEAVGGVSSIETRSVAVPREQRLDLAFPQRPSPAGKEGVCTNGVRVEVFA